MENNYNSIDVLLVEDNRSDAELTMRALNKHNLAHHLLHVKDGAEAIDFILAQGKYASRNIYSQPRLILLDLKLPKMNGLEVLRHIRNNEHTRCIPVVVLTSSNAERDIVESYQLGVNSYIVKPVAFDEFVKAVNNLGAYWMLMNQTPY